MASIFLSHNKNDKTFVKKLANDLHREGIKVWIDEAEIKIGDSLIRKISSGIYEMDYLGVVLSPNSVKSPWVQEELEQALHIQISEAYVKVIPILLTDCEMPGFLLDKLYADFRDNEKYQESLNKILETMGKKYNYFEQSLPKNDVPQERIGDILIKEGYVGLLNYVKQGKFNNELQKFIANHAVQPNLRIMALHVFLEAGQTDEKLFNKLLDDFDQEIQKSMIMAYRDKGFELDEQTLRNVINKAPPSSPLLENAVKLARDLAVKKKISSKILIEEKIINDNYWLIPLCAINGIVGADESDSIDKLLQFQKETYHVSRKKILEYIKYLNNNGKLSDADCEKSIKLLTYFCTDGKSSENATRKMKLMIKQLSNRNSWFSKIFSIFHMKKI